jgi:SAM-dependent methyltransferase
VAAPPGRTCGLSPPLTSLWDNSDLTPMTSPLHIYQRDLSAAPDNSIVRLAHWIQQDPGDVLDLGMGAGTLGRHLHSLLPGRHFHIDGITLNPAEADAAKPYYRQCWVADLETLDLGAILRARRYQWIVCADVLEHLRNPERLLEECHKVLKPEGELLVSIPNASYAGLIADLLHGHWSYGPEGLLDRTHVRFFTKQSFTELLWQSGWAPHVVEAIFQPWHNTEFSRPFDNLPPCVARYILAQPHTAAYQWIFRAKPSNRSSYPYLNTTTNSHHIGMASYTLSLYWDDGNGYHQNRSVHALGTMGRASQEIIFHIKGGLPVKRLRLDPADRPGYWHLRELRLVGKSGQLMWTWVASEKGCQSLHDISTHDIAFIGYDNSHPQRVRFLLKGDDPQIELPIETAILEEWGIQGGSLHVFCDWPWSADYFAAINAIENTPPTVEPCTLTAQHRSRIRIFVSTMSAILAKLFRRLGNRITRISNNRPL